MWQNVGRQSAGVEADEVPKDFSPDGIQRLLDPCICCYAVKWFRSGDFAGWIIEDQTYLDNKICLQSLLS